MLKCGIIEIMTEFRSDPNKNMRDDMNRGVSPDSLANLGYDVPEHMLSDELAADAEQTGHPLGEAEPQIENQDEVSSTRRLGRMTIAQAQENARKHEAQHRQRRGEERRVNLHRPE